MAGGFAYIASVKRDEMCGWCLISPRKENCRERYSSRERNAEDADCLPQTTIGAIVGGFMSSPAGFWFAVLVCLSESLSV